MIIGDYHGIVGRWSKVEVRKIPISSGLSKLLLSFALSKAELWLVRWRVVGKLQ
jgi:hypothetical protein